MMLYPILCIALSLLGAVLSGRIPFPRPQANVQYYNAYQPYAYSYANLQVDMPQEGERPLPAKDVEEMKKRQGMEELAEAQLGHAVTSKHVKHGSTVAIQYDKAAYLKCPPSGSGYCSTSTCVGMKMDATDWNKCTENVFRIYHSNGKGAIRVGDYVAFYFPVANKWFSMYQNVGHLQFQCPGNPHEIYGFHREDSWQHCGAEIFRIHSAGKHDGQIIKDRDPITLYFPDEDEYLRLDTTNPSISTCPGNDFPPTPPAYDTCIGEVFEIRLQPEKP